MQNIYPPLLHTAGAFEVIMQSTANYLWLISDLLGQGATANVYRGRHKVGQQTLLNFRLQHSSLKQIGVVSMPQLRTSDSKCAVVL